MNRTQARDLILCETLERTRNPKAWQHVDTRAVLAAAFTEDAHGAYALTVDRATLHELIDAHYDDARTDRVAIGCPDWCTQDDGHAYDSEDGAGNLQRRHTATLAESEGVELELVQNELAASDARPVDRRTPRMAVWMRSGWIDGPEQARAFARALTLAADQWEDANP